MRHTILTPVLAMLITLSAILAAVQNGSAAEKAPPKPPHTKPDATAEKMKALGAHLGRALDIALDLLSGNEANMLSKNNAALLSGNSPTLLSGNSPTLLSGNAPKVLSENTTPIFSGNTFSLLSNIKVDIHIEKSGNNVAAPQRNAAPNARQPQGNPTLTPRRTVPGPTAR
jgi:hypothetical protein